MSPAWYQILTVLAGTPRRPGLWVRVSMPASRSRCSRLRSPYSSRMLPTMRGWNGRPSPLVRPRSLRMPAIWAWGWRARSSSMGGTTTAGGAGGARAALAAGQARVGEDAGGLGVGVAVQELVDGGDDDGGGLAELRGGRRDGQGEGGVLAGGQADVSGDGVAGPGDGDVGEQQPGDALAFPGGGGGVVPERGQVGG